MFLFPFAVSAQFNKGQLFVGGSLSAQNQNDAQGNSLRNTGNSGSFSITPRIGYFINDKWALGGTVGYSSSFYNNAYKDATFAHNQKNDSKSLSIGLFGRRYFAISEKFFFALEGNLRFSRGNTTYNSTTTYLDGAPLSASNTNTPQYSVSAGVRPLFVFFPSQKWGIETGLGSLSFSSTRNLSDHSGSNVFGLGALGALSLGVNYYFKRS